MSDATTGSCHCGQVTYTLSSEPMWGGHCQCTNCQKFSGTGHASNMVVKRDDFEISGELSSYSYEADSGNPMTRYICANCGTPMYGETTANPAVVVLRTGSLDDRTAFEPKAVIYTDSALAWDQHDPGLPTAAKMPQR